MKEMPLDRFYHNRWANSHWNALSLFWFCDRHPDGKQCMSYSAWQVDQVVNCWTRVKISVVLFLLLGMFNSWCPREDRIWPWEFETGRKKPFSKMSKRSPDILKSPRVSYFGISKTAQILLLSMQIRYSLQMMHFTGLSGSNGARRYRQLLRSLAPSTFF